MLVGNLELDCTGGYICLLLSSNLENHRFFYEFTETVNVHLSCASAVFFFWIRQFPLNICSFFM